MLFSLLSAVDSAHAKEVFEARVTRITDGDTLWVQSNHEARPRKIRIEGIDAPEICQAGGEAASAWLSSVLLHRSVVVMVSGNDVYGRALAKIGFGGQDIGMQMVRTGRAWSYRWRGSLGPYAAEEVGARQAGLGIFADPLAQRPGEFRRLHGPCESTRSQY